MPCLGINRYEYTYWSDIYSDWRYYLKIVRYIQRYEIGGKWKFWMIYGNYLSYTVCICLYVFLVSFARFQLGRNQLCREQIKRTVCVLSNCFTDSRRSFNNYSVRVTAGNIWHQTSIQQYRWSNKAMSNCLLLPMKSFSYIEKKSYPQANYPYTKREITNYFDNLINKLISWGNIVNS